MHKVALLIGAVCLLAACATDTTPGTVPQTPEQQQATKEERCQKAMLALSLARNTAVALILATAKKDKSKDKEIFYAELAYNTALGAATIYGCDITPALMAPLPPRPDTPQEPQ